MKGARQSREIGSRQKRCGRREGEQRDAATTDRRSENRGQSRQGAEHQLE